MTLCFLGVATKTWEQWFQVPGLVLLIFSPLIYKTVKDVREFW